MHNFFCVWAAWMHHQYVHEGNTHCLREFMLLKSYCHLFCVARTILVRCPCVARADSVLLQFYCPKTHTLLPRKFVFHTYNARCVHWPQQYIKVDPTVSCRVTASCSWISRFYNICGCRIAISKQRQLWFLRSIGGSFYVYISQQRAK